MTHLRVLLLHLLVGEAFADAGVEFVESGHVFLGRFDAARRGNGTAQPAGKHPQVLDVHRIDLIGESLGVALTPGAQHRVAANFPEHVEFALAVLSKGKGGASIII